MTSTLHAIPDTDWIAHSNTQLATRLHLKSNYVGTYRRLYKKPKGPRSPGSGRPARLDMSEIDWSLSNAENAANLDCTPQYLAFLRRQKAVKEDFA